MNNSWAAPGVRCVCVNDNWNETRLGLPVRVPMKNEVLTVRTVTIGTGGPLGGFTDQAYLTFWEIDVTQSAGGVTADIGWISTQFEPLVEQQTDISLFTSMLSPAREPANV